MNNVSFFHQFNPPTATAQARRHNRNGATYHTAATKLAAAKLRAICEQHAPTEPLQGPLALALYWTFPGNGDPEPMTKRPDLDNLAKLALDAMTKAGYWQDDAQIVDFRTAKFTGDLPGLAVTVQQWQPQANPVEGPRSNE